MLPENKRNLFLLLGIIIIVLAAGVLATTLYLPSKKTPPVSETPKQEIPKQATSEQPVSQEVTSTQPEEDTSTEEIDTSDWKTYRNEGYGFEIKYPPKWEVYTTNLSNVYLQPSEGTTPPNRIPGPRADALEIEVHVTNPNFSLLQAIKVRLPQKMNFTYTEVSIGGLPGLKIKTICEGLGCGIPEWFVKKGRYLYHFDSNLGYNSLFEQIISTFRFNEKNFVISSPTKGARWRIGETYPIQWKPSDPNGHVVIRLYNNAIPGSLGLVWEASEALPNTGNYFFTVPKLEPGDKYQFVIFAYFPKEDRFRTEYSPLFSILPPE